MTGGPGEAEGEDPTVDAPARQCPSCGAVVLVGDNFCESCGAAVGEPCAFCDTGLVGTDGYCQTCGQKAPAPRDHIETDLGLLAGITDRGIRHLQNEDAMALATFPTDGEPAVAAVVVCDGVSNSGQPERASEAAVQAALSAMIEGLADGADRGEVALAAEQAAQRAVVDLPVPAVLGSPAATFVSAIVTDEEVTVCWLGDSRAYWLDQAGTSVPLTSDNSVAAEMVAAGLLSEAAALDSPEAHVITGWLGRDSQAQPQVKTFRPPGPGVVLVCSDGLWNYAPDAAELSRRALPQALSEPLATARSLVELALDSGGHDNVTVALVPFPLRREPPSRGGSRAQEESRPQGEPRCPTAVSP